MNVCDFMISMPAVDAIIDEIYRYGKKDVENGGFLISSNDSPAEIIAVAFAGEKGIHRHPLQLIMSGSSINQLFDWADNNNYRIKAQFHSHRNTAFMSPTDEMEGLRVSGFVSSVIPQYGNPPTNITQWGWWKFSNNKWNLCQPPLNPKKGDVRVVFFDEEGVQ